MVRSKWIIGPISDIYQWLKCGPESAARMGQLRVVCSSDCRLVISILWFACTLKSYLVLHFLC